MSLQRNTISLFAVLLLAACGGGGGGGDSGPFLPSGAESADADACDNDYYRELIGTYRGQAVYDVGAVIPTSIERCVWTMTVEVEPATTLFECGLRMVTSSELEQSTVPSADDDDAYQCVEENGVRSVYEPNQSTDPTMFEDVSFPVIARFERQPGVPRSSPYFGDDSAIVRNVYLLDGLSPLGDVLRFDGEGELQLLPRELDSQFLNATLMKE